MELWSWNNAKGRRKTLGIFDSCFSKLSLRIFFENRDNTISVIFENGSYYLNLVFSVFFMFFFKK